MAWCPALRQNGNRRLRTGHEKEKWMFDFIEKYYLRIWGEQEKREEWFHTVGEQSPTSCSVTSKITILKKKKKINCKRSRDK